MSRVVLDTNVVVSALLFNSGRLAWVRRAWQHRQLQPLVCRETASELLRVLAYPKFRLTDESRQQLLEDFLPYAEVALLPSPWPALPACRDPHDQVFLVLAHVAQARALITGDGDLLAMQADFPGLIMTPDEWVQRMPGQGG